MSPRGRAVTAIVASIALTLGAGACAPRAPRPMPAPTDGTRLFTFAWRYAPGREPAPRGGATRGPAVELDTQPSAAWRALREPVRDPIERDRRAIRAMAGTYRVSFDFLEVVEFRPGVTPDRPYQSWGTEYVYVLRDEPRFISLQHLLVMFIQGEDGTVAGPFVTKHWRQDWRYQDAELLTYRGHETWAKERISPARARGTWTQAVFQVDDSPRYEAFGRWEHLGNASTWSSSTTWRPLPRREFSVRDDYQVLIGHNRISITPTGWVQEEDNRKVVLDDLGRPARGEPVLAEEIGLARYERVRNFDDEAGRRYRERTEPFWTEVRAAWSDIIRARARVKLRAAPDRGELFAPLFEYAQRLADGEPLDRRAAAAFARETVRGYLAADPTTHASARE